MIWGKLFGRNQRKSNLSANGSGKHQGKTVKYVGKDATVIVDNNGLVLTTWANSEKGFRRPRTPGERLSRINEEQRTMLKACLEKHRDDLLDKASLVETGMIADSVINEMREAIGNELLNSGFNIDGSPNEYGLKLEDLISTLSHYWKSQRNRLFDKEN